MINAAKKRIKEYIPVKIQKAFARIRRPTDQPLWSDLIAIHPDPKEFQPLRDVSHYRNGKTDIDPDSIGLKTDLGHYVAKDTEKRRNKTNGFRRICGHAGPP